MTAGGGRFARAGGPVELPPVSGGPGILLAGLCPARFRVLQGARGEIDYAEPQNRGDDDHPDKSSKLPQLRRQKTSPVFRSSDYCRTLPGGRWLKS